MWFLGITTEVKKKGRIRKQAYSKTKRLLYLVKRARRKGGQVVSRDVAACFTFEALSTELQVDETG